MDEIKVNKFELDLTGTEKNLLKVLFFWWDVQSAIFFYLQGTEEKALAQGLLDPKEKVESIPSAGVILFSCTGKN